MNIPFKAYGASFLAKEVKILKKIKLFVDNYNGKW